MELDDEQRRHEMEGDDRGHEMPVEGHRHRGRQELRGEGHARELDTLQLCALHSANNFL